MIFAEILCVLLLGTASYFAAYCYFRDLSCRSLPVREALVMTRNRLFFLLGAALSGAILIIMFHWKYPDTGLIHRLKRLSLVMLMFPMAAVDLRQQKIPNPFLLAALIVRLLFLAAELIINVHSAWATLLDGLVGAAVLGLFFFLLLLVFKNSIGMGDVKLFAVMGLYQGLWGAMNAVFFSLIASFFVAIFLLITRKKGRKDSIPFGPCILLGTVLSIGLTGM